MPVQRKIRRNAEELPSDEDGIGRKDSGFGSDACPFTTDVDISRTHVLLASSHIRAICKRKQQALGEKTEISASKVLHVGALV